MTTDFAKSDPADGLLIVRTRPAHRGSPVGAPLPADPATFTPVRYTVERSSTFAVYAWIFVLAVLLGGIAGRCYLGWEYWTLENSGKKVPADYEYGKAWGSAIGALGAIGTGLLGATGLLAQFLPQYQTAGVVAANLVVGLILTAAPALFFAGRSTDVDRALLFASSITLVGVWAQGLLDLLLLLNSGPGRPLTATYIGATLVIGSLITVYVAKIVAATPQTQTEAVAGPSQARTTITE